MKIKLPGGLEIEFRKETEEEAIERVRREWLKQFEETWKRPEKGVYAPKGGKP